MAPWNYRVIRIEEDGEPWFDIREVHYTSEGRPGGWTLNRMRPGGDTLEQLKADLSHMRDAFLHPVLVEGDDGFLHEWVEAGPPAPDVDVTRRLAAPYTLRLPGSDT